MTTATPRPEQQFSGTLGEIAAATQGQLVSGESQTRVRAVTTDSRDVPDDSLFVALIGDTHDGHAFVRAAADAGAAAAMVASSRLDSMEGAGLGLVSVDDTLLGLGRLARWHRDRFDIPVVAITGSAGKTTTKEMTAAVLGVRWNVLKTTGNLNNRIGVPLTLFALGPDHGAAVIEAGISLPGEMAALRRIIRPTIRVFLNAAPSHVEFLTDADGVAREKATLFDEATDTDTLVYGADDPRVAAEATARKVGEHISFGRRAGADVRAEGIEVRGTAGTTFELITPSGTASVRIAAVGAHNVDNALAAAAVGIAARLSVEEIVTGLERAPAASKGRSAVETLGDGILLIDDTYNSNPASCERALELLVSLRDEAHPRTVAVLGDMLELGEASADLHAAMGEAATRLGVDRLYAYGRHSAHTAQAADLDAVTHSLDQDQIITATLSDLAPGDVVLVKGSRGMRMENVAQAIRDARGSA